MKQDSLVLGVIMYGMELIGSKESVEVERIQLKFTRIDRCKLGYIVLAKTNRGKIRIKAGKKNHEV